MNALALIRVSRLAALIGAAYGALLPMSAAAQRFADIDTATVDYALAELTPTKQCADLARTLPNDVLELNATAIRQSEQAPAHCRVSGLIDPEIAFEVSLPAGWNGRFYMIGNGGHAGESLSDAGRVAERNDALMHGFAFAQTNTGHFASEEPGASFVLSNPQKAIDYAYRAVHLTATTAKAITADYYGQAVEHAYWNSCSNGGRQGLIEAQRYPDDFDGIIANAPWLDQTGFTIGAIWNQQALTETPLTNAKMELVAERVMAVCDATDGLADGLIDDPRNCDFDPARDVPVCPAGAGSDSCLSPAEAATIARIYSGVTSNGEPFFPGFMPGSEQITSLFGGGAGSGWMNVIVPQQPGGRAADFNLADNTMKYLVFNPPQPDWDFRTFDFDQDPGLLTNWGALADAKNLDLSAFRERGGKLLMTYGWADAILQPLMGVNYYERASARNGAGTENFFRLFMVPGMAHCSGGIGPDQHDSVTAIIDWVEADRAPDSIVARKIVDGDTVRSRPLCPYPQVARYDGTGSIDTAENFSCENP